MSLFNTTGGSSNERTSSTRTGQTIRLGFAAKEGINGAESWVDDKGTTQWFVPLPLLADVRVALTRNKGRGSTNRIHLTAEERKAILKKAAKLIGKDEDAVEAMTNAEVMTNFMTKLVPTYNALAGRIKSGMRVIISVNPDPATRNGDPLPYADKTGDSPSTHLVDDRCCFDLRDGDVTVDSADGGDLNVGAYLDALKKFGL